MKFIGCALLDQDFGRGLLFNNYELFWNYIAQLSEAKTFDDNLYLISAALQANKAISRLQTTVTRFEAEYEAQVPRVKYEEVRQKLHEEIDESTRLKEELESIQSRYE
ncbi:uncharacterized protein DEA37_0014924 [Paragonimus westermani]|uniref:Uncharacterized protein n=1 Tax=Paragonimus westermani TaxID=34504 RepID=A0A5J4NS54_9TREM|nr:uncharacterized protein DEA37_0014924 [Paragonimus westermani]